MDLEIRCEIINVKRNPDVLLADVELKRIDERSLREHPNDILRCFTNEELINELEKRNIGINKLQEGYVEELKEEIGDLETDILNLANENTALEDEIENLEEKIEKLKEKA